MAVLNDDIAPGQLNKRLRIERQVKTADAHGAQSVTWALRAVVWGSVEPLSYREAVQAAAITSTLSSAIVIWWRGDVSVTDRILLGARTFMVVSYQDPTGQQVALRILCEEAQT